MASTFRCGTVSVRQSDIMREPVDQPVELDQVRAQVGEAIENAKKMVDRTAFLLRTVGRADPALGDSPGDELVIQTSPNQPIS